MKKYWMIVDYVEFKPKTYKGVCIIDPSLPKDEQIIIRECSKSIEFDERSAKDKLSKLVGEDGYDLLRLSSFDNYIMDLEYGIWDRTKDLFRRKGKK